MQVLKGLLVFILSLLPLMILFALNLTAISNYACDTEKDGHCFRQYRAFLVPTSNLLKGHLLRSEDVQLKIGLVEDPAEPDLLQSIPKVKDKFLLQDIDRGKRIPTSFVGSAQELIANLDSNASIIPISRENASGLVNGLTVRLVTKHSSEKKNSGGKTSPLAQECPELEKEHKLLAVLEFSTLKGFTYLALNDTRQSDWSKCYKVLEPKELLPVIVVPSKP